MNEKQSLIEVRESIGYESETIADILGISLSEFNGYEENPEQTPVLIAVKLCMIYRRDLNSIDFSEVELTHNFPTKS